jgi:Ser/Thr protein kinase RdoA (MazF antagonist)
MAMGAAIVGSALDQFAADLPPELRRMCETYMGHNRAIGALWNEGERTLIHGDDHIGNLFVDGGRTGFYDWAVASRFPGMRDVAYFLCNSLPTEVRRAEQDALIARYRSGLAARGVDLPADLAHEQYRLFSIYSWVSATTTAAMGSKWQPAEVGYRATVRTTQALIDLDVLGLLDERLAVTD